MNEARRRRSGKEAAGADGVSGGSLQSGGPGDQGGSAQRRSGKSTDVATDVANVEKPASRLDAQGLGVQSSDERRIVPSGGKVRPYHFHKVESTYLDNGIELRVASRVRFPLVTAMVVLRSGETVVPTGRAGLAALSADALEGGAGSLSSKELALALEGIGASFGAATGWDSTTVAVSCLSEHFPTAMPLLAQMVRAPSFEVDSFAGYRERRLASARQRLMNPAAVAADAFAHFVFGESSSYARPLGGTTESLVDITNADCKEFVSTHYGPAVTSVVVVGDMEASEVRGVAEEALGGWDRKIAPVADEVALAKTQQRAVHVLHRPGSVQSQIRVGHMGVQRAAPDFLPLTLLNLILGGSFSSRLNLNLRERHGFTYGVSSAFVGRRSTGTFFVSTAVENAVVAAAIREILTELEAIATDGPSDQEVQYATNYLTGVFPLRMETTGQLASSIGELIVYDLPTDHYESYRDRVRQVTRDQLCEAARMRIRPDELCTVVVGDANVVTKELEELGVGPVTVHTQDTDKLADIANKGTPP